MIMDQPVRSVRQTALKSARSMTKCYGSLVRVTYLLRVKATQCKMQCSRLVWTESGPMRSGLNPGSTDPVLVRIVETHTSYM